MLEGFFKKLRGDLSEGPEEVSGSTIPDADTDIVDSVVEELPTVDISSVLEGESSFDRQLMGLLPLPDKEVAHIDVAPRQEHEPYRYEPDGDGQVCVTKAHLYEVHPKTGAVRIHELDKTIISVSSNCVVYTKFKTDPHGAILLQGDSEGLTSSYTLHTAEGLPSSTQHILKDEDGQGVNGEYNTPIFYIKDGELDRDHWNNREDNPREVKLYGGLRGHRGPLWWVKGYNSLRNIGGGKNVYKEYIQASDFKDLRTIKDKGGSCENNTLGNPFCGSARIRVHYDGELQADGITPTPNFDKANANSIVVRGNNVNKQWYVGDKRAAVVEDGLVNDMVNLPVETLPKKQLDTVTVVTGYSSSSSSVTAAAYPTSSDKVDVLTASGTPVSAAPPHAESDRAAAWSGGSTGNAYTGGTTTSAAPPHAESDRGFAWSGGNMLTQAVHAYDTSSVAAAPTSADATTIYAGGSSAVNAYTGGSTVSVATGKTTDDAWTGGGNGTIVTGVTSQEHTNMWKGGRVVEGAGLEKYKVLAEDEYGNDLYIWVLGISASSSSGGSSGGGGEDDPPDFPRLLTDDGTTNQVTTATAVSSVTAATGYGIVGNSVGDLEETGFVTDLVLTSGGIVGASTTPVVGRTNPVSVLKDTLGEVTNVVRNPQTTPVITGANYSQKFLKGEASPVTGLKKDMTDTTVIANAVDTQKFLKGEASPVSVPVAGSPVSVIKGSLPSVSISVPVATGTAEVYEESTNWTGSLLDAANVSASQGLKVVKEPDTETTNCCTGG